jgi:hypothetical protein
VKIKVYLEFTNDKTSLRIVIIYCPLSGLSGNIRTGTEEEE